MSTVKTLQLADRLDRMSESATIKMAQLARELQSQGHDVISLSLGEPDFDTPDHIKEAAKKALDDGFTKYTPVPGLLELRQAVCTKMERDNGIKAKPSQVVVSNGAKQSIANIFLALLNPGDEVLILAPYWVSYSEIIKLAEGEPVILGSDIDEDYKVSPEKIEAAITDKTKAILFSSPCNPTGSVYTRAELKAIAAVVAKHEQIHIVADEIYEYINFTEEGHCSIGSFPEVADRTITVNGFSKGFAMTGWRLGYMVAPQAIASACDKIQGQITSGANSFGQKAAAYALLADMQPTLDMKAAFLKRRNMMIEELSKIPGMKVNEPQGAFYIFPDISAFFGKKHANGVINSGDDFCEYLLHQAHVAVVTGDAFGAPNCFRISYAASEVQLKEAVKRMTKALTALT
jgi:aspartate aminotransferase